MRHRHRHRHRHDHVFTKAPVLSAVGCGQGVGIAAGSLWNNSEPEVALGVISTGRIVGAMLGSDVNLRDIEGRSALCFPKPKIATLRRRLARSSALLTRNFGLEDVRSAQFRLQVLGQDDGFILDGASDMREISRDIAALAEYTVGDAHQCAGGIHGPGSTGAEPSVLALQGRQIASTSSATPDLTAGTGATVNSVLPRPTFSEGVSAFVVTLGGDSQLPTQEHTDDLVREIRPMSLPRRAATTDKVPNLVVLTPRREHPWVPLCPLMAAPGARSSMTQ